MNPVDIILIIALLIIVFFALKAMRKPTSCSCGCGNCPYSGSCHKEGKTV